MKKKTLHVDYDYDFTLIGICAHVKDYRLCWAINEKLGIKLEKADDLTMINTSGRAGKSASGKKSDFSLYLCENNEDELFRLLVSNKNEGKFLIPEKKQIDFFLIVKDKKTGSSENFLLGQIKSIPLVLAAVSVNPESLKSRQNLMFF